MHTIQNILLLLMTASFFTAIYLQYRIDKPKDGMILRLLGFVVVFTKYSSLLYLLPYTIHSKDPEEKRMKKKKANLFLYSFYVLALASILFSTFIQ